MNKPVKLVMTSEDVLHGFFIPNFRIKQDVVPGMYTSIWFTATVPGKHQAYCTEYCGTSHSGMLAKIVVLDDDQWEAWNNNRKLGAIPEAGMELTSSDQVSDQLLSSSASPTKGETPGFSLVEQGKIVHETKGCAACHTIDGTVKIGPSHKGVFGTKIEMSDGKFALVDENFIRNHIENPKSGTVKGYGQVMPTFKGLITEIEMNALIAYIKSLK